MKINLLQRSVNWLESNRAVNVLLVFLYFFFIYFMHDPVVNLSIWVMKGLSLPVYNNVVIGVSVLALILFIALLFTQLKAHAGNRTLKVSYMVIILTMVIIHFRIMLEMNIEIIHVFEFSILTFLLFPLTRRFGATVLLALPFMVLDEWHQYVVLYTYVDYFELNDVVMDLHSCGLTLIALFICGVQGSKTVAPFWKRPEFIAVCSVLIFLLIALKTCLFAFYASQQCSNTIFVFNRIIGEQNFWRQYPGRDVIYHVMQPLEGITAIIVLVLFYFGLDSFRTDKDVTEIY